MCKQCCDCLCEHIRTCSYVSCKSLNGKIMRLIHRFIIASANKDTHTFDNDHIVACIWRYSISEPPKPNINLIRFSMFVVHCTSQLNTLKCRAFDVKTIYMVIVKSQKINTVPSLQSTFTLPSLYDCTCFGIHKFNIIRFVLLITHFHFHLHPFDSGWSVISWFSVHID